MTPFSSKKRLGSRFTSGFIKRLSSWLVVSTALTVGIAKSAQAATYYWDADSNPLNNNVSLNTGLGGAGAWDTSSAFWFDSVGNADVLWTNAGTETAVFGGTAGAVTVAAGGINAGSLQFLTTGYTLSGGPITLGNAGSNLFVNSALTTTINSVIAGSNGLALNGGGTLTLTAVNQYTGSTSLSNGAGLTLSFSANSTDLIQNSSPLILNDGALTLTGASAATDSQTFASTSVTGAGVITLTQNGATSLTVALGAITQTTGGTLNFSVVPLTGGVVATTTSTNLGTTGILGPWATVGQLTNTLRYATVNGSNQIVAYTAGTAAATGANLTDTTGLVNYDLAAAAGTAAATFSANTIRYTGAAATTAPGATSFTVNGLMNAGTGLWTIGTGNITIGANKELVVNLNASGITVTGAIVNNAGGASGLTLASTSTGTLTLSKAATYTGPTTINSGTLALNIANALNSATAVTLNGGTLSITTFSDTVASVSLKSGAISGTSGILTSTGGFDVQSGTITAQIGTTAGVVKTTPGTVALNPSTAGNTFTGGITIKAGTLVGGGSNNFNGVGANTITIGDTSGSADARFVYAGSITSYSNPIVLSSGTTGNLSIGTTNGSTLTTFSGGITGANNLTISGSSLTVAATFASVNNTGTVTAALNASGSTVITTLGANVTGLTEAGSGAFTITNAVTPNSLTSINSPTNTSTGLLTLTGGYSAGTGTNNLTFRANSTGGITLGAIATTGTITNSGTGTGTTTIASLASTITGISQTGSSPLTVTAAITPNATIDTITSTGSGLETLTGGFLAGTGTNNLVFNANSTGGITVGAIATSGTITNSGTGTGTTTINGAIGAGITGIFQSGSSPLTITTAYPFAALGYTITNGGGGLYTLSGGVGGTGNLVLNATAAGGITLATATVNNTGSITNSGAGTGTSTISAVIGANVTSVTQNSATSNLVLSNAANTYAGPTTITQGSLSVGNVVVAAGASGLGNATSAIILGDATHKGTLIYTGAAASMIRNFTINAGGGEIDSTTATLTLIPGAAIDVSTGPLTIGGAANTTIGSAATATVLLTGTNALTKVGTGTLTLSTLGGTVGTSAAMPINIQAGILSFITTNVTTSNFLGSGLITITPGATLTGNYGGGTGSTISNAISIAAGAGAATIQTTSGALNDSAGAITFAAGSTTATILKLTNTNGSIATLTIGGAISGTGSLQINPTGSNAPITVSGAQNEIGSITNVGTTTATASVSTLSGAIGSGITGISQAGSNPFTVSAVVPLSAGLNTFTSTGSGTFTFSNASTFTGAQPLTFNANSTGAIAVTGTNLNFTGSLTNSGTGVGTTTISSNIGSNVTDIVQTGAQNQLVLSGTNTYTGLSTATAGVLDFINTASMPGYPSPGAGRITVASGATLGLGFGSAGNFSAADVANFMNGTFPVTFAATGTSFGLDTTGGSATYSGVINNGPTTSWGFTKLGANTLTVGAANTYTGPTTVDNGFLAASLIGNVGTAASSLGAPATVSNATISLGFGTFTGGLLYTGTGETTNRVINLSGTTGGGTIDQSGSGTLTFTSAPTFTGTGAKTLTLQGSTGSMGIISGTIAGDGSAGNSPLTIAKAGTGTWLLSGVGNTARNITTSGGILDTGSNGITLSNLGQSTVAATGNGAINGFIFLGANNGAGDGPDFGAVAGVTLTINAVIANGPSTLENIDFTNNVGGTTILTGANTFTGQVQISGQIVQVSTINKVSGGAPSSNLGAPTTAANGTILLSGNSTLRYVGTGETTDRVINLSATTSGGTIDQSGTGLLKFSSNFATPGAGAKTFTLQGSTAGTGEFAGVINQNSTTNTTSLVKAGTGTWTLSAANTYTGSTAINGGNLIESITGGFSNTAITINNGGMFSPVATRGAGNTGTTTAGATLTLNPGGVLNMADGTVGNFTLTQGATFAGTGAAFNGGSIILDLSASGSDTIVSTVGPATSAGSNAIAFNLVGGSLSAVGPFNVIQAGGTLNISNFYLATPNIYAGGQLYTLSLAVSGTNLTVTVSPNGGTPATPASAFWSGALGSSWSTQNGSFNTNFVAAATGVPDTFALPGVGTNVTFAANSAGNLSTTLDQSFEINSLTFTGAGTTNTAGSTIANGTGTNVLQIDATNANGNTAGNGLTVLAGSGPNLISANMALGASQTWTINSTTATTVSGAIGEINANTILTKMGAGTLVLNGLNTFSGGVIVNAGTISVATMGTGGGSGGLGTGLTDSFGSTTTGVTFIYTGTGENTDHVFNMAGTTGGLTLDQSGSGNLKFTSAMTDTGAGIKTLTLQGSTSGTGELSGVVDNSGTNTTAVLKTGTGAWTLGGTNTYTGNTTVANGTLNFTGSVTGNGTTTTGSQLIVGNTAGQNAVVNINGGSITNYYTFLLGTTATSAGVINMTGGTFSDTTTATSAVNIIGQTGYGYLNITGGTFIAKGRFAPSNGAGTNGVVYIGGTGTLDTSGGEWFLMAYSTAGNGGNSEVTVGPGGTLLHAGASANFGLNMDRSNGYAVLNVAGAGALVTTSTHNITFGNSSGSNILNTTGILNLSAGTLTAGQPMLLGNSGAGSTGNLSYINFAGGTLQANAGIAGLLPASIAQNTLTATVFGAIDNSALAGAPANYTGGLTIDTQTFAVTNAIALAGATGFGVTQANLVVSGGAGYVGAPFVQFSKPAGGGVPASGYALISGGVVTGIVITNPGTYASGETPTITLSGGGATSAATVTSSALATSNANTGGLTKRGNGSLTLTGSSTFGGAVDIKGGLLTTTILANGGLPSGIGQSSNAAANVLLDGGILGYSSTTTAGTTDRNFTFAASGGGFDASGTVAAATFTLTSSNNIVINSGLGAANFVLQGSGTAALGVGTLGSLLSDGAGTTISLTKLGAGQWNLTNTANSYSGATTINGGILSASKLDIGGNSSSIGQSSNAASNLVLNNGTLQYTGTGAATDRNFTFGNATTAAGGGFDSEGTGALVIANMTAVNTAAGTQTLTLTANAASGANTIGSIVDSSGTALTGVTKAGAGSWTLAGANAYSGATLISAGTLTITGTNSGASAYSVNASGTVLNVNSSGTVNGATLTMASGATVNLNSGTFALTGNVSAVSGTTGLNFNGGTLKNGGTGPITISANLPIAVQAGGGTIDTTGGNITSSSTIGNTASPGTLNIMGGNTLQSAFGATFTGNASISGAGTTVKFATTAAAYAGTWSVGTGATLDLNNVGSFSFGGLAGGGTVVNTGASALQTITLTGTGGNSFGGVIAPAASPAFTALTVNLTSGTQTFSGSGTHTYTGATTISGGTLAVTGASTFGNTAITVNAAATGASRTLALTPGTGTITIGNTATSAAGATLTLANGSTASPVAAAFTMVDNAVGTVNLLQGATFAGSALTLGGASVAGYVRPTMSFDIGGSSLSDIDRLNVTQLASVGTGGVVLTFSTLSTATSLTTGDYTFLTAAGGLGSNFTLGTGVIALSGGSYQLSLANSTSTAEILTITALAGNAASFWSGGIDGSWASQPGGPGTATNFVSNVAGTSNTLALPDSNSNVTFTANSASHLSTTLDQSFVINSLGFSGSGTANTAGTTIAPGAGSNTLTINATAANGNVAGSGITVASGSGANTISANVVLGATQTWTIAPGASLTVSGDVSGAGLGLTLAGGGSLTLSGSISYTGPTVVSLGTLTLSATNGTAGGVTVNIGGQLNVNSPTGLGTGTLTLNGGAIDSTATFASQTVTTNPAQLWTNGAAVAFTGTNALNLGTGAVTLNADATTGTFQITNNSSLSGTSLTIGGAITPGTGGTAGTKTLTLAGAGTTALTGNITKGTASGVVVTVTASGTTILSGAASTITTLNVNGGANSILDLGAGSLSLSNAGSSGFQSATGGTINATGGGTLVMASTGGGTNFLDNGTANGTTLTVNAKISGANGLEIYGGATNNTGVVVLAGANTFTGGVAIDGGILSVASLGNTGSTTSNLGTGSTITIFNSALNGTTVTSNILRYTGTGETSNRIISLSGTTSGGAIEQAGTGLLKLTANFATPGAGAKTLYLMGSTAGTGEISGLIINNSGTNTTGVMKLGTGTWTLSGISATAASNYTGVTTIDRGTLAITHATTANLTGGLVFGSALASANFGNLDITGGNASFGPLTVQNNNATANTIAGGSKTLTINGAITVGSVTTLASGLTTSLVMTGGAFVDNLGAGAVIIGQHNSGATTQTGTGVFATLDLSAANSVAITGTAGSSIVLGASTTTANGVAPADVVQGTLKLSAAGANTISATTITLGHSPSIGPAGVQGYIVLGNSTNTFQADTIYVGREKSVAGTSPATAGDKISFAGAGGTWTLGGLAGSKTTLNIGYNDAAGTGTFSAGIVDLTGGNFNGTLGTVSIGFYAATAGTGGAQGTLTIAGGTTTADAVILSTTGGSSATQASGNNAGTLNLNGGTFTLAAAGTGITMGAGTLLGNATVNLAGGTLNLNGTNIGSAARPVTFNAQQGTLENLNELNGGAALVKTTNGTLLLDTSDAYTGVTTVSAGVLQIANGNALGGTTNGTTVAANAALEISNNITTAAEALNLNGAGVSNGGALRNTAGSNTFTGVITVASATRINSDAGNLTLDVGAGNAIGGTASVTFGGAGRVTVNDAIAIGANTVTKDGSGTLVLAGANTYTGLTDATQGKVVVSGSIAGDARVASGATLASGNNTTSAIAGNVIGLAGGTIAPGDTGDTAGQTTVGRLNVTGDLTVGGAGAPAHLAIEIGLTTGGTLSDQIQVAANSHVTLTNTNLDLTSVNSSVFNTSTLTISSYNTGTGLSDQNGTLFFLLTGSTNNAIAGTFANAGGADPTLPGFGTYIVGGQEFAISYQANATANSGAGSFTGGHDIALMAIPEPSSLAMLAGSVGLALSLQRFRRRRNG